MTAESDAVRLNRGKWAQPDVPHKGWICIGDYDTYETIGVDCLETCGMCESKQIRFVQVMVNQRYNGHLLCGCICAGHMSEDLAAAEVRDQDMRSRAGQRQRFPKRKMWRRSKQGTPYIKVEGFHLMVVNRDDGKFGVAATPPGSKETVWGKRRYDTLSAAQRGCFDAWKFLSDKNSELLGDRLLAVGGAST